MRQNIRQFAQIDEVLTKFSEFLCDAIVVCEPMVSEVFSCWVLDRVESTKSSIVAYVLPLPLVRFELKEVGPIFNHELVELIELLLCALILHIVLQIFIRL